MRVSGRRPLDPVLPPAFAARTRRGAGSNGGEGVLEGVDHLLQLAGTAGVKIERSQVELDKPIKSLGAHKIKVHLHPEVTIEITAVVARSVDEAEFLAKGGALVAENERAALEAAESSRRAAEQAAALFEAKPAEGETAETAVASEEAPSEKE